MQTQPTTQNAKYIMKNCKPSIQEEEWHYIVYDDKGAPLLDFCCPPSEARETLEAHGCGDVEPIAPITLFRLSEGRKAMNHMLEGR